MKKLVVTAMAVIGLGLGSAQEAAEPQVGQTWQGQAAVRFFCTSTLHNFSGEVPCETFECAFVSDPNSGKSAIRADVEASVRGMDTHNKARDKNLRKMFEAERFPRIHASIRNADAEGARPILRTLIAGEPPQEKPGTLALFLKIRAVERPVLGQVRQLQIHTDRVTFRLNAELSLKAFNLKPPSVLGLIRVGDNIHLEADVTLRHVTPDAPSAGPEATAGSGTTSTDH